MSISLSQYIDKIKAMSNMLLLADKPVQLASGSALFEFSKRVFQTGESTTGGKFQYNSTTPLYVNPEKSPGQKFKPQGKPQEGKKRGSSTKIRTQTFSGFESDGDATVTIKTKIKLTSRWFPSYKDYREKIGYESSFVNFILSGDLKSEIENRVNNTLTTRKFADAEYTIQTVSKENSGKLKGFATKYVGVFKISESEKKTYYNALENELLKQIDESLK